MTDHLDYLLSCSDDLGLVIGVKLVLVISPSVGTNFVMKII